MALKYAWYKEVGTVGLSQTISRGCGAKICLVQRGWDSGYEPNYGVKTSSMVFEVVAVVIRQCALKNCSWQMFLGANGE